MNLSENFIRKPVMTMLVMVVVFLFGMACYFILPVSDLPVVDFPVITVNVNYPGASPNTMANTVALPLENQFSQIPGLASVISDNTEGTSKITLTFNLDKNVDLAAPDVQAAIQRAMGDLPNDLPTPPSYTKTNPSDAPIIYITLNSATLTPGQLYDFGNKTVGQRLSMVDGVSQVQVWGAKTAVRVQLDPNKLAAYKIGLNEISDAVNNSTVTIPGGSLDGEVRTFSIEPQGQLFQGKDYNELIVAYRNNAPVRLKDLGVCIDGTYNDVMRVLNGSKTKKLKPGAIVLAISREAGSNTIAVAREVKNTLKEIEESLPGSIEISIFHDKTESIVDSINDVNQTIIIALILVILIIFLFLGSIRDTIIPSVTLPLSIIATFIVMYICRFSVDNLSMMGLTLSVGFVVDDAIVVLENTVRLIEEGKKPFAAAVESAKQITFTVISMTLSLAVIFIPLVFMGGVIGKMFRELSITVIIAIICSGIISLTLTPMMCARMLTTEKKESRFQKKITGFLDSVIKKYGELLMWTLKRPLSTFIGWVICFVGTVMLFMALPQSFLPEGDSGVLYGQSMVPLGTSTEKMQKYQDQVANTFLADPDIEEAIVVSGINMGADQSTGPVVARLKPRSERKGKLPIQQIAKRLRIQMSKLTQGMVFMRPIPALQVSAGGESTASGSKYSYVFTGPYQEILYKTALDFEQKIKKIPGILDVQNSVKLDLPQLNVEFLRDRASTLGITANDIEQALTLAYSGGKVTSYKTETDIYYVVIELLKKYQRNPENLSHIYLHSSTTGGLVPLGSLAKWSQGVGPQDVPHYNQLNAATISFNIDPAVPLSKVTKAVEALAKSMMPEGASGFFQGEAQQFQDAMASLGILILIAVFIKYVILGILYENYMHPITILTTLPVATFGGLLTLYLFGSELSLYAYIGLFMLLGIVAKNGIMMVDFANENLRKGNVSNLEAMYQASIVRFRPILMTGLAAIMGALPIALGYGADGASRRPLGLIVVGGLIFSQVVTLFITPGLFLYMQRIQERFLDKFELTRSEAARKKTEHAE